MNTSSNNQVSHLEKYKVALIAVGKTTDEKKFISDSFTRWYFNAPKKDLIPLKNIVLKKDLMFANKHRHCRFGIPEFIKYSSTEFKKIKSIQIDTNEQYINKDHLISKAQMDRLKSLYVSSPDMFEHYKNKLIAIYEFVGINSAHLSVPPETFKVPIIECFGSPLNTSGPYCSPFAFETEFGSLGSFFDIKLSISNNELFLSNPPFDEEIMEKMTKHLIRELTLAKSAKTVVITIPVWDSASQKKLGLRDFGMDFIAYSSLISCKFIKEHTILDRAKYPYWDFYKQSFISVSFTHLIILSNGVASHTIEQIKQDWTAACVNS